MAATPSLLCPASTTQPLPFMQLPDCLGKTLQHQVQAVAHTPTSPSLDSASTRTRHSLLLLAPSFPPIRTGASQSGTNTTDPFRHPGLTVATEVGLQLSGNVFVSNPALHHLLLVQPRFGQQCLHHMHECTLSEVHCR